MMGFQHGSKHRGVVPALCAAAMMLAMALPAGSADFAEQQQLVDKAKLTLEAFTADPALKDPLRDLGPQARALFIIPQFMRGAFIFGGAGGSGVLLVRHEKSGTWGQPVFYNIGSASFGLQIGADVSEIVLVVRTTKGLEKFYSSDFKLGGNAGMAAARWELARPGMGSQRTSFRTPDRRAPSREWRSKARSSTSPMPRMPPTTANRCARSTSS